MSRAEFQGWLDSPADTVLTVRQKTNLAVVIRMPKEPRINYLFGTETLCGDSINREDSFTFCGLYNKQTRALYLASGPLPNIDGNGIAGDEEAPQIHIGEGKSMR